MFHQVLADGPFRIDQTFALPSGSLETIEAQDFGNLMMISPSTFDSVENGAAESFPLGEGVEAPGPATEEPAKT